MAKIVAALYSFVVLSFELKLFVKETASPEFKARAHKLIADGLEIKDLLDIPPQQGNWQLTLWMNDQNGNDCHWKLTAERVGFSDRFTGKIDVNGFLTPIRQFMIDICNEGVGYNINNVLGVMLPTGEFRNSDGSPAVDKYGKVNKGAFKCFPMNQQLIKITWGSGHEGITDLTACSMYEDRKVDNINRTFRDKESYKVVINGERKNSKVEAREEDDIFSPIVATPAVKDDLNI